MLGLKKRTPADNFHLDLMIAESNGISIDLLDSIPLSVVEPMRDYFHALHFDVAARERS